MTRAALRRGADGPLREQVGRALFETVHLGDPLRIRFWDEQGLTMAQLRLMFSLLESDGQMLSDLAAEMHVTPPTITGLTDRLVKRDLLERKPDPNDRRVIRASLTPAGVRALREFEIPAGAFYTRVFEELGEEQTKALLASLRALLAAADKVAEDTDPA